MSEVSQVEEAKRKKSKKLRVKCSRAGVITRPENHARWPREKDKLDPLTLVQGEFGLTETGEVEKADDKVLEASSSLAAADMSQSRENYNSTMINLTATLHQWPWFKVHGTLVQFTEDPPPLFYPSINSKDRQKVCDACHNSGIFFECIEYKYLCFLGDVKKRNADETKELPKFLESTLKLVDQHKCHELQEFAEYVLEISGNVYKADNFYRIEWERWKRLKKYVEYMESKKVKMEERYSNRLGDNRAVFSNKNWKALNLHVHEGKHLKRHCEKNIEEAIVTRQIERVKSDPLEYGTRVSCTEDIYVNRISNAIMMDGWLKSRLNDYREMNDTVSSVAPDPEEESSRELELMSIKQNKRNRKLKLPLRLCNARRRPWNKVKPRLPQQLSHLFMFGSGPAMERIHPTWFRILMTPSRVTEEHNRLGQSNIHLECAIEALEKEMQHLEVKRRLTIHMQEEFQRVNRRK